MGVFCLLFFLMGIVHKAQSKREFSAVVVHTGKSQSNGGGQAEDWDMCPWESISGRKLADHALESALLSLRGHTLPI